MIQVQAIGVMIGFFVAMQAGVAFETARDRNLGGLKFLSAVTFLVAILMTGVVFFA